jgi:hypothetical protein
LKIIVKMYVIKLGRREGNGPARERKMERKEKRGRGLVRVAGLRAGEKWGRKRKGVGPAARPKLVRKRKTAQGLFGLYKTIQIFKQIFYFTNYFEFKHNLKFE